MAKKPPCLTYGDSSVVALRAVQAALARRDFNPFPQPPLARLLAKLLNNLPFALRVRVADRVSASIGHPARDFDRIDPTASGKWVTSGYTAERYPGLILGAPGLAVTFLSALTGFPFLPQPLLFNARRNIRLDDAEGYMNAGAELAEPLVRKHPETEATIHYDPVHDRFLIRRLVFIRLKFLSLPPAYAAFIKQRLIPGAPVILVDCESLWPRAEVSRRLFFQLGGLGGITPQDYLEESQALKDHREQWGAPKDASWGVKRAFQNGPESEWASSGSFLDEAAECTRKAGHRALRFKHDHPAELSKVVFDIYRHCWQGSSPPRDVYVAAFTHIEPRFPLVTGSLPIWLPFITDDSLDLARNILTDWRRRLPSDGPEGTAYVTLHPSFCSPPDMVPLDAWRSLLSGFFEEVRFIGVNTRKYPADLAGYTSMYPAAVATMRRKASSVTCFRRPALAELEETLTSSA